ncbi:hypothetical protein JFL43_20465 [Viridibacillus sp. YIM B01967]|jgi:hypothetical protein|uniref:Uncharacterized protein n=1 Tax=Viridibacillus soli TaxID=2798301 RepID=A0ABS1HCQ3_9BACL|nr:hypothetical protein [Viridibacillus soli]MBK3497160.1 hypothetical protein [Viridibacillus soli]
MMKFANKKQIQRLYREQIRMKKDQDHNFIETIIIILVVAIFIFINLNIS